MDKISQKHLSNYILLKYFFFNIQKQRKNLQKLLFKFIKANGKLSS